MSLESRFQGALLKSENGKCEYLTKVDGAYEIDIKDGSQYITVSYIGYDDKKYLS